MSRSSKSGDPLLGWFEAGADLVSEQLSGVTDKINSHLEKQKAHFEEFQRKGAEVDANMKASLNPRRFADNLEQLVKSSPLWSLVPDFSRKPSVREQKIALLSAKVDLLVEQVAMLAAAEAKSAEKATVEPEVKPSSTPESKGKTATSKTAGEQSTTTATKPTRRPSTRKKTVATTATPRKRAVKSPKSGGAN